MLILPKCGSASETPKVFLLTFIPLSQTVLPDMARVNEGNLILPFGD
jgi:hypothetical protein